MTLDRYNVYEVVISRSNSGLIVRFPQDWDMEGFDLLGCWKVSAISIDSIQNKVLLQECDPDSYEEIGKEIIIITKRVVMKIKD